MIRFLLGLIVSSDDSALCSWVGDEFAIDEACKELKAMWDSLLYDYHERENSRVMIARSSEATPEKARFDNYFP